MWQRLARDRDLFSQHCRAVQSCWVVADREDESWTKHDYTSRTRWWLLGAKCSVVHPLQREILAKLPCQRKEAEGTRDFGAFGWHGLPPLCRQPTVCDSIILCRLGHSDRKWSNKKDRWGVRIQRDFIHFVFGEWSQPRGLVAFIVGLLMKNPDLPSLILRLSWVMKTAIWLMQFRFDLDKGARSHRWTCAQMMLTWY